MVLFLFSQDIAAAHPSVIVKVLCVFFFFFGQLKFTAAHQSRFPYVRMVVNLFSCWIGTFSPIALVVAGSFLAK